MRLRVIANLNDRMSDLAAEYSSKVLHPSFDREHLNNIFMFVKIREQLRQQMYSQRFVCGKE